jgi:hypothetical protein
VALAVAALAAITLASLAVVRRDPYRPGTSHQVTVQMSGRCLNPEALFLDGRSWDSEDFAPPSWTAGTNHPGRLAVIDVDEGVFTADGEPTVTITFRRQPQFSDLRCGIR